ncbi:MAG: hypothetical protein KA372_11595, partial [Dokdonella sp.]|nr:hypothetical protein [Dokdonella sp.]
MVVLGSAVHAQESAGDAADAARKASLRAAQYVTAEDCARLDDPKLAQRMDGLLHFLAKACSREADFIGQVESEPEALAQPPWIPG